MVEYPFKDLLPLDEVLEREGYYNDWTHLDPEVFYSLTQISEYIKTKGYGVDVRLLIAQLAEHFSLKTAQINEIERLFNDVMNELTKDKEFHSLPEIASARRGYKTLAESLSNLSFNMFNTNLGKITPNLVSDELLAQIAGNAPINAVPANNSLTTTKFTDKAVTIDKTTFAKKGKNIFDGNFTAGLAILGGEVGTIDEYSGAYLDITKVQPNTKYKVTKQESNRFRIYSSSKYPEIGDTVELLFMSDKANAADITTLEDTQYLISYVANGGLPPEQFQIGLGHARIAYESPNKVAFDLLDKSVETRAINEKNGVLDGYPDGFNISFKGQTITTSNRGRVTVGKDRFTLKEGVYPISGGNYAGLRIFLNTQTMDITTVPTDTSGNPEYDHLVNLGTLNRIEGYSNINGMYQIEGKTVLPFTGVEETDIVGHNKKTFIPDKPSGAYDFNPDGFNPNTNRNYDTLLSIYDGLVTDFPEYVSREHLADEESGLPLYLYRFAPRITLNGHKPLKILIFVTHGHEVWATYGVAHSLNSLAREWQNDSRLNMIRHNVEILVVPQSNPYGFNLGRRPNYNGVDIARNYPDGWSLNDNPEPGYGTHGPEPLSEIGNQVTYQVLLDNLDADFVIDNHNYGGDPTSSTSMPLMWLRASNAEAEKVVNGHIHQMVGKARLDGYVPMDKRLGGIVSKDEASYGSLIDQVRDLGLDGTIMENMNTLNGSTDNSNVAKFNTENLGNLVINAVRYYG